MVLTKGYTRPATPADTVRLLELEYLLFDNAMSEALLERELEVGHGEVFCSDRDGSVVGYALLRHDGDLLDLTRLGVDPEAQGTGVGKFLLQYVLVTAQKQGRDVVLTVKKANRRALHLYLRQGFAVVGHISGAAAWALRWTAALDSAAPAGAEPRL